MSTARRLTTRNLFDAVFATLPEDAFIDFGPESLMEQRALMAMNGQDATYVSSSSNLHGSDDAMMGTTSGAKSLAIKRVGLVPTIGSGRIAGSTNKIPGVPTAGGMVPRKNVMSKEGDPTVAKASISLQIVIDQDNEAAQQAALYAEQHRKALEEASTAEGTVEEKPESGDGNTTSSSGFPPVVDILSIGTTNGTGVPTAAMNRLKMTAEEQIEQMPPGLPTLYEGTCATMQPNKGFGFITPDLGGPDIYFTRESVTLTFTRLVLLCYYVRHNELIPPLLMEGVTPPERSTRLSRIAEGEGKGNAENSEPQVKGNDQHEIVEEEEEAKAKKECGDDTTITVTLVESEIHPVSTTNQRTEPNEERRKDEEAILDVGGAGKSPSPTQSNENGEQRPQEEEEVDDDSSSVSIEEKLRNAHPSWFNQNPNSASLLGTPSMLPPLPPATTASLNTAWIVAGRLCPESAALLQLQLDVGIPSVYRQQRLTFSVHRNRVSQGARRLLRAEQVRGCSEFHYATPEEQAWFCDAFPHAIGHKHYECTPHRVSTDDDNGNKNKDQQSDEAVQKVNQVLSPARDTTAQGPPEAIRGSEEEEHAEASTTKEIGKGIRPSYERQESTVSSSVKGSSPSRLAPSRMLERYSGFIRTYNPESRKGYIACDPKEALFILQGAVPGESDPMGSSTLSDVMFYSGSLLFDPTAPRHTPEEGLKVRYSVVDRSQHNKYIATLITGIDDKPFSKENYLIADENERAAAQQPSLSGNRRRGFDDHGGSAHPSRRNRRGTGAGSGAGGNTMMEGGENQQAVGSSGISAGGSVHKSAAAALQESYVGGEEDEASSYHHHGKSRKRGRALLSENGLADDLEEVNDNMMHVHSHAAGSNLHNADYGMSGPNGPVITGGKEGGGDEREEDPILFMDDYEFT